MPQTPVTAPGTSSWPAPHASGRAPSPSSPWHTPLPQPLPTDPRAASAAPSYPSAAGLDQAAAAVMAQRAPQANAEVLDPSAFGAGIPEPVVQPEHTSPILARKLSRRGIMFAAAGVAAALLVIAIATRGGGGAKEPVAMTDRGTDKHAPASRTPEPETGGSTKANAVPAPHAEAGAAAVAATGAPAAAPTATPAKTPARPPVRRFVQKKKPVVVDYDRNKDPETLDHDQALAQARAAWAAGNQHLFAGQSADAITSYKKALAVYPNYAAGYRGLGLAYAQEGQRPAAVDAFTKYLALAPSAKDVALIKKRIANLSIR